MGLADFTPFKAEIISKSGSIFVRGLSLDDCRILLRAHMEGITKLMELAQNADTPFGAPVFFMEALQIAPDFLFDVIAMAADEPSYAADARKLPAGLQIKILQEITGLTMEDIGGPKSLLALVQKVMGGVKSLPSQGANVFSTSTSLKDEA